MLDTIVTTITNDKKLWLDTMMAEELKIAPVDTKDVLKSSVIVTITMAIGHIIPVAQFFFIRAKEDLLHQ